MSQSKTDLFPSANPLASWGWRALRRAGPRIRGQTFYCHALSGLSDFSIGINADLTVSCNCADRSGAGNLGDLQRHSFAEIFAGARATELRQQLSRGRLPLPYCASCSELRVAPPSVSRGMAERYCLPFAGLMVENTSRCNLRCRGCDHEKLQRLRRQPSLTLAQMARVAETVGQLRLQRVYFFNLGEPFLSPRVGQELGLLRAARPGLEIVSSSNGLLLDRPAAREAALQLDLLLLSLDGPNQQVLEHYQVGGDFARAYQNLKDLVVLRNSRGAQKPLVEWKYVLFRHNEHPAHLRRAIALARAAGADAISFWPGHAPWRQRAWRYRIDPGFRRLAPRYQRWWRLVL